MNVDHFITIGSAHNAQGKPCEDYALSGTLPAGAVFGVVADGCSGANANTDVGARAISWAFRQVLEHRMAEPGEWFANGFGGELERAFASLQFPAAAREDYLATVVGFAATPEKASVFVHGDGAVAIRFADGRIRLVEFNWWDNTPFYLNYQLHRDLMDRFEGHLSRHYVEQGGDDVGPFGVRTTTYRTGETGLEVIESTHERFTMDALYNGHVINFRPAEEGIDAIAVLTDGVEQFGETPAAEVAKEFVAFKNHQGEFVKRRLLRALKDFRKDGLNPRDDVGIAAVWFSEKA